MRGTLKGIEVERWGGEQARQPYAGSLNPSKTSIVQAKLSGPASALFFIVFFRSLQYMSVAKIKERLLLFLMRRLRKKRRKNGPLSCGTAGLSTGQDQIRQSFSRFRLIAPRFTFLQARIDGRA